LSVLLDCTNVGELSVRSKSNVMSNKEHIPCHSRQTRIMIDQMEPNVYIILYILKRCPVLHCTASTFHTKDP